MPTQTPPPVPESLRLFLANAVERGNIGTDEVLAVLQVLSWAENDAQMAMYLSMLRAAFPFMAHYEAGHGKSSESEVMEWLKPILTKLITKDPSSASTIMRRAVEDDVTIALLEKEFPILSQLSRTR